MITTNVCGTNIEEIYREECLGDSLLKINNNFLNLEKSICELRTRVDAQVEVRTFFYYGPNAASNPASGMVDNDTSRPSDMTIQAFVNSETQLNLPNISKPKDVAYVIYQKTGFLNTSLFGTAPGTVVAPNAIITQGNPVSLSYGVWYNVNSYFSATASCNGQPFRLGTITLEFRPRSSAPSRPFVFRARGGSYDDTVVSWDRNNITFREDGPFRPPRTVRTQPRPFKEYETAQFRYKLTGNVISKRITAVPKISVPIIRKGAPVLDYTTTTDIVNSFSPVFIIWRLTCQDTMFYTVDTGFPKFTRSQTNNSITSWASPQLWSQY